MVVQSIKHWVHVHEARGSILGRDVPFIKNGSGITCRFEVVLTFKQERKMYFCCNDNDDVSLNYDLGLD